MKFEDRMFIALHKLKTKLPFEFGPFLNTVGSDQGAVMPDREQRGVVNKNLPMLT